MNSATDTLSRTPAVSAIVRRICFKLNAELAFRGHKMLSLEEHASLFDLGDASRILDGVAVLPGMAQHEERARRDLLELFAIFDQDFAVALSEGPDASVPVADILTADQRNIAELQRVLKPSAVRWRTPDPDAQLAGVDDAATRETLSWY